MPRGARGTSTGAIWSTPGTNRRSARAFGGFRRAHAASPGVATNAHEPHGDSPEATARIDAPRPHSAAATTIIDGAIARSTGAIRRPAEATAPARSAKTPFHGATPSPKSPNSARAPSNKPGAPSCTTSSLVEQSRGPVEHYLGPLRANHRAPSSSTEAPSNIFGAPSCRPWGPLKHHWGPLEHRWPPRGDCSCFWRVHEGLLEGAPASLEEARGLARRGAGLGSMETPGKSRGRELCSRGPRVLLEGGRGLFEGAPALFEGAPGSFAQERGSFTQERGSFAQERGSFAPRGARRGPKEEPYASKVRNGAALGAEVSSRGVFDAPARGRIGDGEAHERPEG